MRDAASNLNAPVAGAGDELHLAHDLAIQAATTGGGHPVPQLDTARANTGTASAFVARFAEL